MKLKYKHGLKFGIFILLLLFAIFAINFFNLGRFFDIETIRSFIEGFGYLGPAIFILIYITATIVFIPGTPLTIAAGALFGTFIGLLYTIIGATIGATIAFSFSRFFGRSFVKDLLDKKFVKLKEYDEKLEKNGFVTMLILRFLPFFPFNGLNFALGLTKVKTKDYILATVIGIIPGSFVLAYFGDSLAMLSVANIILSASLFALMIFISPMYKWWKKKLRGNKK